MTSAAQQKFAPSRSMDSMGRADQPRDPGPVILTHTADQTLRHRLRRALADWSEYAQGTRDGFADQLQLPAWKLKKMLATEGAVRVDAGIVVRAEQLARDVRPAITDQDIVEAWKRYELARRDWEEAQERWEEGAA